MAKKYKVIKNNKFIYGIKKLGSKGYRNNKTKRLELRNKKKR